MSVLPFEVLTLIFKDFDQEHLGQCQLVCKTWNQASLKLLYTDIYINFEEVSRLYVRTIKNSPQLGMYLESVYAAEIFQKQELDTVWDTHGLLNTIIKFCPNVLALTFETTSSPFWSKLAYAASQGRLPRLEYISRPYRDDFDHYAYTLLSFKKSITTLELPCLTNEEPELQDSEAYPTLRESLHEFLCLKNLNITYICEQPFSNYDKLIDDCKHLEELILLPAKASDDYEEECIVNPILSINPHQNIQTLQCKWWLIKEDIQLNYVMQKFPNLKSLSVLSTYHYYEYSPRTSLDVLVKFLDFATNIEKVKLEMVLEEQECIKVWADIIREKFSNLELRISLMPSNEFREQVVFVNFDKHQLNLKFVPSEDTESLYSDFLSVSGENIQRLILDFIPRDRSSDIKMKINIRSIIRAIQSCPLLQRLEFKCVDDLPFRDGLIYRHTGLKSLLLSQHTHGNSAGIFRNMSLILPNLKEVEYRNYDIKYGKSKATVINMPNSSLDILKWTFIVFERYIGIKPADVYIKLSINSMEKFYVAFEDEISPIGSKQYNRARSSSDVYLEITCQNLIKLQINKFIYTIEGFEVK